MTEEIRSFLDDNRIGVVSVQMVDGSVHSATVHIAHHRDPLAFIFLTGRSTRKVEALLNGEVAHASLVIGTNEDEMKTFQLDGTATLGASEELTNSYFTKFPEKKEKYTPPESVFCVITPTWWRYSDMKAPGGKRTVMSHDGV